MSSSGPDATQEPQIVVVSDGTGDTASTVVRASMAQFRTRWRMRVFGGVRHEAQVRRAIEFAARDAALVVYSLVNRDVVRALRERCEEAGVATVDLLGPLIAKVAERLHAEPRHEPGLLHGFSDDYLRRVDAVEFAVRHDDGANLHTLFQADLVLTGVSRTSKTPLSMYLAQRGYKTGNVPLIPGLDPPRALIELDPRKVFGLIVDPGTLLTVRKARIRALGATPRDAYSDPEAVQQELVHSRRLFRERGWRTVNIAGKAVEENAARILDLYQSSPPR